MRKLIWVMTDSFVEGTIVWLSFWRVKSSTRETRRESAERGPLASHAPDFPLYFPFLAPCSQAILLLEGSIRWLDEGKFLFFFQTFIFKGLCKRFMNWHSCLYLQDSKRLPLNSENQRKWLVRIGIKNPVTEHDLFSTRGKFSHLRAKMSF